MDDFRLHWPHIEKKLIEFAKGIMVKIISNNQSMHYTHVVPPLGMVAGLTQKNPQLKASLSCFSSCRMISRSWRIWLCCWWNIIQFKFDLITVRVSCVGSCLTLLFFFYFGISVAFGLKSGHGRGRAEADIIQFQVKIYLILAWAWLLALAYGWGMVQLAF